MIENGMIRFTKDVTFRCGNGDILKVYRKGDVEKYTAKTGHYFVTTMGGIYFDEAEKYDGSI